MHARRHRRGRGTGDRDAAPETSFPQYFRRLTLCLSALHGKHELQIIPPPPPQLLCHDTAIGVMATDECWKWVIATEELKTTDLVHTVGGYWPFFWRHWAVPCLRSGFVCHFPSALASTTICSICVGGKIVELKGTNPPLIQRYIQRPFQWLWKGRWIYPKYMPKCSVGSTDYVCSVCSSCRSFVEWSLKFGNRSSSLGDLRGPLPPPPPAGRVTNQTPAGRGLKHSALCNRCVPGRQIPGGCGHQCCPVAGRDPHFHRGSHDSG